MNILMTSPSMKVLISLLLFSTIGSAQFGDKSEQGNGGQRSAQQLLSSQSLPGRIVMDGPVDPNEYMVGPGDIFAVNIWSAVPLMFQVPVTPEGTIVIPTVAEITVTGMTLQEARTKALSEIKKKYITATASFTLQTPRSFTVTMMGAVLNEGPVVIQSSQRVDRALQQANDVAVYQARHGEGADRGQRTAIQDILSASSLRNILIQRRNGVQLKVDIEKYRATGNTIYNPLLTDGDVVITHPRNLARDYVGIYGAVTKEGVYEFVDGDSLSTLIRIAAGLTPSADGENAVLYRTTAQQKQVKESFSVKDVLSGAADRPLLRGDRIVVPAHNIQSRSGTVKVEGEVLQPGSYPIIRDSTTLSEVIAMAGGFTRFASLNAARVVRESKDEWKRDIDYLTLKRGVSASEDTIYFANEMLVKLNREVSNVDFKAIFSSSDRSADIVLFDGDKIIIPQKVNAVYVFGEVLNPGYVSLSGARSVDGYIALAGGLTEHAVDDDIRIIKASSKQWLVPGETSIEDGDYIWVPKKPYRTFAYYLGIYSQVFATLGTVATLFLIISQSK